MIKDPLTASVEYNLFLLCLKSKYYFTLKLKYSKQLAVPDPIALYINEDAYDLCLGLLLVLCRDLLQ